MSPRLREADRQEAPHAETLIAAAEGDASTSRGGRVPMGLSAGASKASTASSWARSRSF